LRIDITFDLDLESAVEQTHQSAIRNPQSAIPNLLFLEDHGVFRLTIVS